MLKYLFCFAEPDFAPRQGHQHSAFVAAELQQAQLVCRGEAGEAVGGLLGAADGGRRGRLKRFYPLLLLPCGHTWRREQSEQLGGTSGSRRERSRAERRREEITPSESLIPIVHLSFRLSSWECAKLEHPDAATLS